MRSLTRSFTPARLFGALALVMSAAIAMGACTDGTTPDCSGNPSPCGYEQPPVADAASQGEGGG
jgi:hypothetical protein